MSTTDSIYPMDVPNHEKDVLNDMAQWALDNNINFRNFNPYSGIVYDTEGDKHQSPYALNKGIRYYIRRLRY